MDEPLKFTQYFLATRERADRGFIKIEWIEIAILNPLKEEIQSDNRVRRWAYIDTEQKYLRVVLLEDGETVHNAFFDRSFKP